MRTVLTAAALLLVIDSRVALAQRWNPPPDTQRCPSKWGAGDQRGSANHMRPETVLRAARLIQAGEVFELGRVLSESMPMPAGRRFEVLTKRTRNDAGSNRRGSNEELVVGEIGQVGTQFDTFSHQTIGSSMYNCITVEEAATRTGFSKLGVEEVGALMTRGVLLDIAALKGVPMLAETYEITPQDLEAALTRQKLTLSRGDATVGASASIRKGAQAGLGSSEATAATSCNRHRPWHSLPADPGEAHEAADQTPGRSQTIVRPGHGLRPAHAEGGQAQDRQGHDR